MDYMDNAFNKTGRITVRVHPDVEARVSELATYHGRGVAEEVRVALAYFDHASTLAYLQTAEAAAELGDALTAAQEETKRALRECGRIAFARPSWDGSIPGGDPTLN